MNCSCATFKDKRLLVESIAMNKHHYDDMVECSGEEFKKAIQDTRINPLKALLGIFSRLEICDNDTSLQENTKKAIE